MAVRTAYIVSVKRSPIGHLLGGLSKLRATEIGAQVAAALLDEVGVDRGAIDEAYVGQVLQAGVGQNPARQVALGAGLPDTISCATVNKVCGSGLQAVMFADQVIRLGEADLILAGGMESMSNAPHLLRSLRSGHKFGAAELVDCMEYDGLLNVYDNGIMGVIADETGAKAGVSRADQDRFALQSHQRAAAADDAGNFRRARVPIRTPRSDAPFDTDETIRRDARLEKMASLKPVFKKDGTVTAANASSISDGAAMTLIASEAGLKKCNVQPLARIVAHLTAGGPPRELFFTPIAACKRVCEKAGWTREQVDLWEINEAFAAQMLACIRGLELDEAQVNVNGGAIALGHPIGASGARLLGTLAYALKQRGAKRGVASLCLGGGNAVAMAVETV
jgi:acetyl-CoA C-acetyltransferase